MSKLIMWAVPVLLGVLGLLAMTSCSETGGAAEDDGTGAAGEPRAVNLYTSRHYDSDEAVLARFTEETGIRVNVVEGSSDELLARLEAEGELGSADLFMTVDAGRLYRAEQRGLFAQTRSASLDERVPAELRHPEGLWFGLTKRARVIAVSTERVDPSLEALTYEDLTSPEWRGRVLIRSSSNIYNQSLVASMIETVGEDATQTWCEGIVANLARTPQGGDRDQIRGIAAGEGDIAVVNHYYYAQMLEGNEADREAASKVRLIFPNQDGRGTHVNISGAGVLRTAKNQDAAITLLEYLVSAGVQRDLAGGTQEFPVAQDAERTPIVSALGDFSSDAINAAKLGANNARAVILMDRAGWR